MGQYASYIVQTWQDGDGQPMRWRVCSVHDQQEVCFPNAVFLIRFWIDDQAHVVRCLVRHIQNGCEVQLQSGESAIEFVRAWLKTGCVGPTAEDSPDDRSL